MKVSATAVTLLSLRLRYYCAGFAPDAICPSSGTSTTRLHAGGQHHRGWEGGGPPPFDDSSWDRRPPLKSSAGGPDSIGDGRRSPSNGRNNVFDVGGGIPPPWATGPGFRDPAFYPPNDTGRRAYVYGDGPPPPPPSGVYDPSYRGGDGFGDRGRGPDRDGRRGGGGGPPFDGGPMRGGAGAGPGPLPRRGLDPLDRGGTSARGRMPYRYGERGGGGAASSAFGTSPRTTRPYIDADLGGGGSSSSSSSSSRRDEDRRTPQPRRRTTFRGVSTFFETLRRRGRGGGGDDDDDDDYDDDATTSGSRSRSSVDLNSMRSNFSGTTTASSSSSSRRRDDQRMPRTSSSGGGGGREGEFMGSENLGGTSANQGRTFYGTERRRGNDPLSSSRPSVGADPMRSSGFGGSSSSRRGGGYTTSTSSRSSVGVGADPMMGSNQNLGGTSASQGRTFYAPERHDGMDPIFPGERTPRRGGGGGSKGAVIDLGWTSSGRQRGRGRHPDGRGDDDPMMSSRNSFGRNSDAAVGPNLGGTSANQGRSFYANERRRDGGPIPGGTRRGAANEPYVWGTSPSDDHRRGGGRSYFPRESGRYDDRASRDRVGGYRPGPDVGFPAPGQGFNARPDGFGDDPRPPPPVDRNLGGTSSNHGNTYYWEPPPEGGRGRGRGRDGEDPNGGRRGGRPYFPPEGRRDEYEYDDDHCGASRPPPGGGGFGGGFRAGPGTAGPAARGRGGGFGTNTFHRSPARHGEGGFDNEGRYDDNFDHDDDPSYRWRRYPPPPSEGWLGTGP